MPDEIKCPKCESTQISVNKKGFGVGKAAVGVLTLNAIGALAGMIGSNKIRLTCLNCGHQWKPGKANASGNYVAQNISNNESKGYSGPRKICPRCGEDNRATRANCWNCDLPLETVIQTKGSDKLMNKGINQTANVIGCLAIIFVIVLLIVLLIHSLVT